MKGKRKKIKHTIKLITLVLTLIMLVSSMPFTLQAMAIETMVNIEEVKEYREEYSKHFKMPDGTFKAVSYNAPVHRMDENGEWQDLENILSESTVKNKQAYVTSDGRTVFSKNISADDNTVFELNDGGYSMKVSFENEGIKNSNAKLSNHAKKYVPTNTDDIETQYEKLKEIDTNTTVRYKNILKNIDLEYILSANDIKENIIIRKACEDYEFSFIYELIGLSAILCEDGSISVYDSLTNEVKYSIPAPYMYDDNGEESTDVAYSLDDLGNGRYRLTVTPDESWINAEDRAFPVTVDPTVTANYFDTYISASYPNANYSSSTELWVSTVDITFMDIHNSLPVLPDDATITYANLNVRYYYNVSDGYIELGLYKATFGWYHTSLTWNVASQYSNNGISTELIDTAYAFADTDITSSSPETAIFDVTELIKFWYIGGTNQGIAIKRIDGTNNSVILKSYESGANTLAIYDIAYSTGSIPFTTGTYFLRNCEYDNYAQLGEGASVSPSGASLEIWSFDGGADQRWHIEYMHNGFYRILSLESNLALTAQSIVNTAIVQNPYYASDNQLWSISSAGSGQYKISPASSPSYRMAIYEGHTGEDGSLIQMKANQNDDSDEWKLIKVESGPFLLGIRDSRTGHDHYSKLTGIASDLIDGGCTSINLELTASASKDFVLEELEKCSFFVYRGHGDVDYTNNGTMILLTESQSTAYSKILTAKDIYDFDEDDPEEAVKVDLSNCAFMLFVGCKTATENSSNHYRSLVRAAVNAGAGCAVGFTKTITCRSANYWIDIFFYYFNHGYSVIDSANNAQTSTIDFYLDLKEKGVEDVEGMESMVILQNN